MPLRSDKRLLFFSPLLAMPSQHGGCVYPHAVLSELAHQGYSIDYAWLGSPLQAGRRIMRSPLTAPFISSGWIRGTTPLGSILLPDSIDGWLGRKEKLPFDPALNGGEHTATPAEIAFATRLIRKLRPHAVLIDSTPMLTLLDGLSPKEREGLQVAVLTHNLNSRRTDLYRQFGQPLDFLPMSRDEETRLLARADIVIAIQDREAAAFRSMVPERTVITVPMPATPQPQPEAAQTPGQCLFVGGYSGHNIESVRWLLSEIWPNVIRELPSARLVIAGTVGKAISPPAHSGVLALGPVDHLEKEYAATSVCLVPLPLGTGLKIKLIEAMGYGRAVLTTSAGAEGFAELEQGKIAVVADSAGDFSRELIALLQSPSRRQEIVARQSDWLARNMTPAAALASYTQILPR